MGGVSSSLGDLFYPDNPNRRRRATQLKTDVEGICFQFDEVKEDVDKRVRDLQPKLNNILEQNGYASVDELGKAVETLLSGNALREWQELTKNINRNNLVEEIGFTISSLVTIGTGVVLGGAFALGVITGATAISAISTAGSAMVVLTAALILWAVFEGGKERINLRNNINSLSFARVDAMQALRQLEAYRESISMFDALLTHSIFDEWPGVLQNYLNGEFKFLMAKAERSEVLKELKDKDDKRPEGAWRDEDPDVTYPLAGSSRNYSSDIATLVENFRGESARSIAAASISCSEIMIRSGVSAISNNVQKADNLAPARVILQLDPANTPVDDLTALRDFSFISEISSTTCQVQDNDNRELYRIDAEIDLDSTAKADWSQVRFSMLKLSTFETSQHIGVRVIRYLTGEELIRHHTREEPDFSCKSLIRKRCMIM